MKQISIFVLGSMMAFASVPAQAQDFSAGKTPAQLFNSDCAECHRSPSGLGRNRDVRMLATFLREHYTTKSDTASALAAYVSGFSGGAAARNRGTGVAAPANAPGERRPVDRRYRNSSDAAATEDEVRTNVKPVEDTPAGRRRRATNLSGDGEKRGNRSDGDAAATEDDARTNARPVEDTAAARHRRAINLSGDGEKRRNRGGGDVPRPPASIDTAPAPRRSNAPAHDSAPRDAADPISQLRSYLSSGLGFEGTIAEAAKMGAPKGHKHRNRADTVEPAAPGAQATAKTIVDAPPPASPPATNDALVPAAPPEDNASSPSMPSAPPTGATSTRTEQ